jgi:membrane protein YqaA with SNARE-associated domain
MWWHYILVFLGALFFYIVPFPFPPAFSMMMFFQILFDSNVWVAILVGVAGSVLGRYILLLYSPLFAKKYLKPSKNADIQLLGDKLNQNKWKGKLLILTYSLLPLPTTPLFLGAGISKIRTIYIIPSFIIGQLIGDKGRLACWKICYRKYAKAYR